MWNAPVASRERSSGGRFPMGVRRQHGPSQTGWGDGPLRRGESDGTGARTRRATGVALLVPRRKRRSTSLHVRCDCTPKGVRRDSISRGDVLVVE